MSEFKEFCKINKGELFKRDSPRVNSTRPRILTIMFEENGKWVTPEHLKYFQMPQPSAFPLNLAADFENYQTRDPEYFKPVLSKLANYLVENDGLNFLQSTSKQQIITTRYVLKYLMNTPYQSTKSQRNNWSIKGTKFRNIIFLTGSKRMERKITEKTNYHFKFRQYCFSDSPNSKPNTNEALNENNHLLFGIFRTKVDDFEILYSAKIFGVESEREIEDFKNEEVLNKTNFVITKLLWKKSVDRYPEWKRIPHLFRGWIQSYLGCVENFYVGFKTENGFVNDKIEQNQYWEPEACKRFLRDTLSKIQCTMKEADCPYTVFEFTFDSEIQAIQYRVFEGKSEHSFLEENFIQYIQKN